MVYIQGFLFLDCKFLSESETVPKENQEKEKSYYGMLDTLKETSVVTTAASSDLGMAD